MEKTNPTHYVSYWHIPGGSIKSLKTIYNIKAVYSK